MNLNKVDISIIRLLINSKGYISSYDISNATGISRRSIRNKMINVKKRLEEMNCQLISKPANGYMIEELTSDKIKEISKILTIEETKREEIYPTAPWERQNYIKHRIIESNSFLKVDDLADELLVSRTTISAELKEIREQLKKYNLTMTQKPNYGINIQGDERDKRKALCDFTFSNLQQSEMFNDYISTFINANDLIESDIHRILSEDSISIADIALCDFLICIMITLSRLVSNNSLESSQDISPIKDRIEFNTARKIAKAIENRTNIILNENEINEIAIQLICKRSCSGVDVMHLEYADEILNNVIKRIDDEIGEVLDDSEFIEIFKRNIEVSILRGKYRENIRHPLFDRLKYDFPLAYECSRIVSSEIEQVIGYPISKSQLAFFTSIFESELRKKQFKKNKALFVFGIGNALHLHCIHEIEYKFSNQLEITNYSPYHLLKSLDLSQYDVLISNFSIHDQIPLYKIHISSEMTSEDLDSIEAYINYYGKSWRLTKYFLPRLFKTGISLSNKNDIFTSFQSLLIDYDKSMKNLSKNTLKATNVEYEKIYKNILFIKMKEPVFVHTVLPVIVLNKPMKYNDSKIQIIILCSCSESDYQFVPRLRNKTNELNQKQINKFLKEPSFKSFISMYKEK